MKKDFISIILPVYNVAPYIDQCMESVTGQTYEKLEIILVNDGSDDGSLERCLDWAGRDPRVIVLDQENRGVAAARNAGIDRAEGEYLCFIDPDDWVEKDYCEKLLSALLEADADYAECDLWRYDNRTGRKIYRACYGKMGAAYDLRQHMKYGPTATYKALSRKALWDAFQIRMPECSFESPAVYSLILALARKIVSVREPLYYYRRFREASLVESGYAAKDGTPDNMLGVAAMRHLVSEFVRCGIYEEFRETLEGVVKYRLSDILAMQYHRRKRQDYLELVKNCRAFLAEAFPEGGNTVGFTFGGYNLNRILTHMNALHDPDCRFNFSSSISLLKRAEGRMQVSHKNRYREIMVNRELSQAFFPLLAEKKPAYLVMDLIEERFDILDTGGRYITLSDAFEGARERDSFGGTVIRRTDERCRALWQESFDLLVRTAGDTRILVIENYLSEKLGNIREQRAFGNLAEIREINAVLEGYYRYIRERYPEIPVIPVRRKPLYFTDEEYEYGAVPSHLNEWVNMQIAEELEQKLREEKLW